MTGLDEARRRALWRIYRRYLEADRAWAVAVREMRLWFPADRRPPRGSIGDPGSPLRRAYERRERALLLLEAARRELAEAAAREARRRRVVLVLPAPPRRLT